MILAVGTTAVLVTPVLLIGLTSYIQLSPFLSGYDVGLENPAPPPDLLEVIVGFLLFGLEGIAAMLLVGIACIWIRVEHAISFLGMPLILTAAISGWWRLSAIQSLGLLALAFAVVGVLTGVAIFLNRLLEPKEVMYEPVVLSNSGWDEPADESEAD